MITCLNDHVWKCVPSINSSSVLNIVSQRVCTDMIYMITDSNSYICESYNIELLHDLY